MDNAKTDDDLSFDFSKVKVIFNTIAKFFSSPDSAEHSKTHVSSADKPHNESSEYSFNDLKKAKDFLVAHKTASFLLLLIILQFLPNYGFLPVGGLDLRLKFQGLPFADRVAKENVYNSYFQKIVAQVSQQNANLPADEKYAIAQKQFFDVIKNDKVNKDISVVADRIREQFQYSFEGKKYTLIPDIDSFYYLRLADNVIKRGYPGDSIKNNHIWDSHVVAPTGAIMAVELHPYTLAYLHKLIEFFDAGITLMQSSAYFPVIAAFIGIIMIFFIGRAISGDLGGLVAAIFFSMSYIGFTKTMWGMIDTDAYNLVLPALFLFLFLSAFQSKKLKIKLFCYLLSAFVLGIYAFAWAGWWHMFYVGAGAIICYGFFSYFIGRKNKILYFSDVFNQTFFNLIIFMLFSSIFIGVFLGHREYYLQNLIEGTINGVKLFFNQFLGPLYFSKMNVAVRTDLWPNVYTTVEELQSASLNTVIAVIGGGGFFLIAIFGVIALLRSKDSQSVQLKYGIALALMSVAAIYAALKGKRFSLLLVVPFSIAASYGVMVVYSKISDWCIKKSRFGDILALLFLICAVILLNLGNVGRINFWLDHTTPLISAPWWDSLKAIQKDSVSNAIITSWWDFGHQFAYVADRAVTFDGGSQNTPMAYWIGKVLSTRNEDEAVGILRMLACGSNKAYDSLYEQTGSDVLKATKIVNKIVSLNKDDARKYLEANKINDVDSVLKLTHCDAPQDYFITSEDMGRKAGVWSHFGNWDFEKAYALQVLKGKPFDEAVAFMIDNFNYTRAEAESAYEKMQSFSSQTEEGLWIAPIWTFSSFTQCKTTSSAINCGNTLFVNPQTYAAKLLVSGVETVPKNLAYVDSSSNEFVDEQFAGATSEQGAILFEDDAGQNYASIISPELGGSMFARLMYFNGVGLEHFKLFSKRKLMEGGFVSVWKIDWNSNTTAAPKKIKKNVMNDSVVILNLQGWIDDGRIIDSTIVDWKNRNITSSANFDDYVVEPRVFKMGAGQILPQLESALQGMAVNQTKVVSVPAPLLLARDPELADKLQNKTISFKMRVEKIK